MLKLEPATTKEDEVSIKLSNKEPLLTKQFIRAFGIAIFLHLFCFTVFRVESVPTPPQGVHKAIMVEIDSGGSLPLREGSTIPLATGEGLLPRYLVEPKPALPELPGIPRLGVERALAYERPTFSVDSTFSAIHNLPYRPGSAEFHFIRHHQPIQLNIAGPLAQCRLVDDGMGGLNELQERIEPLQHYRITFEVQMDHQTGKIFSIQATKGSRDPEIDSLALAIVRRMRFEPMEKGLVTTGHVELRLELGAGLSMASLSHLQRRE